MSDSIILYNYFLLTILLDCKYVYLLQNDVNVKQLAFIVLLLKLVGAYYERQGSVFSSSCGLATALNRIKLENGSERGRRCAPAKASPFLRI